VLYFFARIYEKLKLPDLASTVKTNVHPCPGLYKKGAAEMKQPGSAGEYHRWSFFFSQPLLLTPF
jgi:hypothetical protein